MDNTKNDEYYVQKIYKDLSFIISHMQGVDANKLKDDEVLQDSMMFRLIQVFENSQKLSEEFKTEHTSIPWMEIKGLRNRIVHEYGSVDVGIVYDTLQNDIPVLLSEFLEFVPK